MNGYIKIGLGIAVGAALGFIYYTFWGCESGCSIKSSPELTMLYGALFGFTVMYPTKKIQEVAKENDKNNIENTRNVDNE